MKEKDIQLNTKRKEEKKKKVKKKKTEITYDGDRTRTKHKPDRSLSSLFALIYQQNAKITLETLHKFLQKDEYRVSAVVPPTVRPEDCP